MKSFVVIGLGRFGSNVAITLSELGNDVLAIDENEERVSRVSDKVTHAVVGDPKDESVLRSIGVRNFDCAVVALSDDLQSNALVTLMLKEMGVPYVVAKAQSDLHMRLLEKIGADKVVYPEKDMGMKLAQSLSMSNILDYIELSDEYSIVEVRAPQSWVGKTLRELNVRGVYGVNVMAVKNTISDTIDVSPDPDAVIAANSVLVVIGSNRDIARMTEGRR